MFKLKNPVVGLKLGSRDRREGEGLVPARTAAKPATGFHSATRRFHRRILALGLPIMVPAGHLSGEALTDSWAAGEGAACARARHRHGWVLLRGWMLGSGRAGHSRDKPPRRNDVRDHTLGSRIRDMGGQKMMIGVGGGPFGRGLLSDGRR
jgi:hypothetical protein